MKNILITGGSGLIGKVITSRLKDQGFKVAWLSRNPETKSEKSFNWDIKEQTIDQNALDWCDAIIHLAGAGVADKKWSQERKLEILNSRIMSTELLVNALGKMDKRPEAVIAASAIGYYGMETGNKLVAEGDPAGNDFLAEVVDKWEKTTGKFENLGIRTVRLRVGIVLSKDGGALPEMMKPPVAAPLGDGKQYMSWIHIQDLADIFIHALTNSGLNGVYNAVGPTPVSNAILTRRAAKFKGKPFVNIGVPGFALKLALGEMAEMVLGGNRVSNDKIHSSGFQYQFPELDQALKNIFKK
ncbi:TIGR01777 family oxidoreductase [Pleomorphovibrio marinus]|uniref:TIGR01777 family oxidoreductase n=1 Tax=Pleomorphovibrio marinus TaxID=2164132 RepID=UPI000E0C8E26|nr:TIGR01777 family oxidoreductase [Pleomorphovibrio marinus]